MKIATYNINGVNGHLPILLKWLKESQPDIVCLQELKAPQEKFPIKEITEAGYNAVWKGQKSWNGVAILSKGYDITEVQDSLPGDDEDVQSRYLEVIIEKIVICCLYIPNGNPYPGEKYEYKLSWLNRLKKRADELLDLDIPAILIGDFNIIPTPSDVYKPEKYKNDALFTEEVRKSFEGLVNSGWKDSLRSLNPDKEIYTFWDYMFKAYNRNAGMRIDHILLSPYLESRLENVGVDKEVRGWEKTSDHAPTWIKLED
ncbi:exodeoxyribonuclease-3 [Chryseobacterium arachidis]|uniref:Exodeoxyribonuclease-3 n=1 Tax=Chryseobacterium arachidis TaxID=1416778 RepID=A0A1M5C8X5_9FLAO|nr:exodeoxyribonuclease III [Chryseobacterium arachidis]SHF51106.1 exodeoxyribonuclease-3 [Chryseobacterium arachidis]